MENLRGLIVKTLKNITHGQIALDLVLDDAVFFDMLGRGKRERERERERGYTVLDLGCLWHIIQQKN